jgi:iron complex outermembrane receptor protein
MNSTLRLRSASLVAAAVAIVLAQNAVAQEETTTLGEITVTARKRSESLQDVPFAISARTGEQLAAAGASNIEDVSRNVAGFTVLNLGPGQSQAAIRGVSGGKIDRDLPGVKEQIGVYMDESPISLSLFTPDLDLYDLNRVEVLRGPQGTLFGSGSIGGTVRYISNQPDLTDGYGDFEVGITTISEGGDGGFVRGMFNVPLSDRAALRVVGYFNEMPGFVDARGPGGTLDEDVNDGERQGGRVALRWELTDNIVVTPRVIYQDIDINGYNREDDWNMLANEFMTTQPRVNLGRREQYRQLDEHFDDDFMLGDLTMEFDFGPAVLTSVSSYTDRDILVTRDATQLSGSVTYFNLGGDGDQVRLSSPLYDYTTVEMFTQELRLSSDYEGGFQWVIGAFYSDTDRKYGQRLPTPGYDALVDLLLFDGVPPNDLPSTALGAPVNDMPFYSNIPYQIEQTAIFAEANFRLGEKANVAVGGRYYDFSEDRVLTFGGLFSDPSAGPGSTDSDGFQPRVLFSYDFTEDVQVNAQYSQGFRLGGINDPLNLTLCTPEDVDTFGNRPLFDDEELTNYEIGAKIGFAEGRGQFNISAFHAEIDDLQAVMLAGSCSSRIVMNVPEAHSTGAEFELFVQPTERFDFGISASYVESKVDSDLGTVIQDGDRQPAVPEFSLSANATYTWPFSATVNGFITGTYQHVGSRYTQIADQRDGFGTFDIRINPAGNPTGYGDPTITSFTFDPLMPAFDTGNIRLGVRGDEWEAALFVNNVSDEYARLGLDQERGRVARVGYLVNQPRTYGISFSRGFGRSEPAAAAPPPPPPPPPPAPPPPPPAPPPPGDQDKDGVTDDKDRCPNTTQGVAVDDIGCFREVALRGLLFGTDSTELSAQDRGRIDQAIAQYKSLPDDIEAQTRITIEGHTDNTGADAYNQGLSERRANAVRDYVVSQGVNPAQITTVGKGESEPTDDNSTAEGRQNNRRVVIRASR